MVCIISQNPNISYINRYIHKVMPKYIMYIINLCIQLTFCSFRKSTVNTSPLYNPSPGSPSRTSPNRQCPSPCPRITCPTRTHRRTSCQVTTSESINQSTHTVKPVQFETCIIRFLVLTDIDFHSRLTINLYFLHCVQHFSPSACRSKQVSLYNIKK